MRGSLAVRLNDGTTDRIVTGYTRDLRFRKTAPGGFASASCQLVLPRDLFRDLGANDRMYVTDSRTARTVWEGFTENPGVTDGPEGQSFELSVMGSTVLASDRAERLIYLDTALDNWRRDDFDTQAPSGTADVPGQFPDGAGSLAGQPGLYTQLNPGQPVNTNSRAGVIYDAFMSSPMTLGGIAGAYDGGSATAGYRQDILEATVGVWWSQNLSTTDGTVFLPAGGGALSTGRSRVEYRVIRTGAATNVTTDDIWACLGQVKILGQLVDRTGTARTMSTASHVTLATPVTAYVLASEVAEDLLGRILTACDSDSAQIAATTAHIDQLSYGDATTADQVLTDLALYEPDFYWGIGAAGTTGKFAFWFRGWPTSPRYIISTQDGYNAPGGEVDLCNRIAVNWTDEKGVPQTTLIGAHVPELGNKSPILSGALDLSFTGRIKDAEAVSLPDGQGSLANAQLVGASVLASKNNPGRAATATVKRPIDDLLTGGTVMPWEIEPGYLVRVRETGEDLRLTETEYVDSDCSATLTLGTPVATSDELIVRALQKRAA